MRAVGVKKLKAQLSSYLRQVRMGETVLVTDRDEVIAELGPPRSAASLTVADDAEQALERLSEEGSLVRARKRERTSPWAPTTLGQAPGTAQELLDALRADRE